MSAFATAPANIALIKYMGKEEGKGNIPLNPSLSYTLEDCLSFCEVEAIEGEQDYWEPLEAPGALGFTLSETAKTRYLSHLHTIKSTLQETGYFVIRSCNNFPMNSGLASSASSFAALTKAAVTAICEKQQRPLLTDTEMAHLSRQGSGSSCRSFFKPYAMWDSTGVHAMNFPFERLIHHVILISEQGKSVSSSEAHQRVLTSPHFQGRPERATNRLKNLIMSFDEKNWMRAYEIIWEEFSDMHQLFETAVPTFHYLNTAAHEALAKLKAHWERTGDGPLVTVDAGPNIHLLFRADQQELAIEMKQFFLQDHDVI